MAIRQYTGPVVHPLSYPCQSITGLKFKGRQTFTPPINLTLGMSDIIDLPMLLADISIKM